MPTVFRRPRRLSSKVGSRLNLPSSFSGIFSTAFAISGAATVAFSGIKIVATIFSSAGAAQTTGAASSTATTTLAAAGAGTPSFAGITIRPISFTISGVGSASYVGKSYYITTFAMAGVGAGAFNTELRQITSTLILQKPVDYALAGEQGLTRPGRASGRALAHAFGE